MDTARAEDLFQRSISLNKDAFQAGSFDVAFHALASALHSALDLESDQPLLDVDHLAKEQLAWIDQNHPEYKYSTESCLKRRGGRSIFEGLSVQAETNVKLRQFTRMVLSP